MKKFTQVNNSQGVIGLLSGLKSRITTYLPRVYHVIAPMLFVAFGLFGVNEAAWGKYKANVTVTSSPSTGGYVYVGTSSNCSASSCGTKTSDDASAEGGGTLSASGNITFYFCNNPKSGYVFKGWSTSETANSGEGANKNPYSKSLEATARIGGGKDHQYYAIFARLTARSTAAMAFGTKLVGAGWSDGTTKSVTIDYVHAGKISATITGTNATEFSLSSSSSSQSKTVVSNNTNSETNYTITVYFKPTSTGNKSATLTISSDNDLSSISISLTGTGQATVYPTFTNTIAASYFVEDGPLNLASLWTSDNKNGAITYSKVSFTADVENEAGATIPSVNNTTNMLSLGQSGTLVIQMHQEESTGYYAKTVKDTIRINKRANALSCSWESWSKNVNVETQTDVTFSSNNGKTPIVIEQTSGDTEGNVIATYSSAANNISSLYNIGTATWTVSQAENYKYVAAVTKTLTVNVVKGSTTCNFYTHSAQEEMGLGEEWIAYEWSDYYATEVSFQAAKNMGTAIGDLEVYIKLSTGSWQKYKSIKVGELDGSWGSYDYGSDYFTYSLASNVRGIKFKNAGDYSRAIKNLSLKRHSFMTLSTDNITMPTNTLGGNHTTAKFTVDYSTCADQIKVVSNHPHITVSPASFASDGNGTREITVTYACGNPESIEGVITVYTPYENKTITVYATTEKKSQKIEWSELFAGETVSLPQTFTSADAASATSKLPVKYNSGDPEIIAIAEDSLSFTIVGTGTTTLTATQAGNGSYKSVSDSKTINASNKKIQRIIWNQQFTRSLSIGYEIPLTATVSVLNVATGVEAESNERSAEIVYTCPDGNNVIEIFDYTNIRVLGYGNTTITASVGGNEEYEAAASVTLPVRVREIQTGDCDMPLVLEQATEIEFFQGNLDEIIGSPIAIDHANGVPDKLSFDVRGAAWKLAIEYYGGSIQVQQSTNNKLSWSGALTTVSPAKGETASSGEIQLDPNATHIRFVRPKNGTGYHYVGNIQITRLPYIRTEETTLNLGNISMGETRNFTIPISYCNVKGNMTVSKQYGDNGLTAEEAIEAECGDMSNYEVQASIQPVSVGPWSNVVTVRDQLSNMYLDVTVNATITKGDQVITWNPTLDILATEAPVLNAIASSGLTVSYDVTSGKNTVARIENGQVVILQPGQFAITASQGGNANYNAAKSVEKTFTVSAETLTILEAPTASDITYGQSLGASTLTGGSVEDSKGNAVTGTFAWQTGSTAPNAGNAQEFIVVFTPDEHAAWYNALQTTATVNVAKMEPMEVNVPFSFCAGESVTYRGTEYTEAGKYPVNATGANRDTVYNVIVTVLQPSFGTDEKTIVYGAAESWHGTDLSTYAVGSHEIEYHTTNAAGCDSTVTLTLTVNKQETLNVPVDLEFCAGGSEAYRGTEYTEAGTYNVPATGATRDTVYVVTVTVLQPTTGTDTKTIVYGADESWNGIALKDSTVGVHYVVYKTTNAVGCDSTVTLTLTVTAPLVNEFTNHDGDGDWSNPNNWTSVPTDPEPNIIVSGDLEIEGDITVGNLTIEKTGSITVITNGTLTVKGESEYRAEYGDIHVLNDGELALGNSANLQVRDFTLDAKLAGKNNQNVKESAASGQVENPLQLAINRDAYFQMTFDPKGKISFGWYDFVVPFPVNISDGIFRAGDLENHLVSGVDFIVQEFSESRCANNQKAWTNFYGTMQPGRVYTITFNYDPKFDQNVFVFKKASGATIGGPTEFATQYTEGNGTTDDYGWNGLGNGMLQHGYITGTFAHMQVFNHAENKYDLLTGKNPTFAIGTSFFVQVDNSTPTMKWNAADANEDHPLYAPKRETFEVEEFLLSMREENQVDASDHLYISGSEEATEKYVIGHDLRKMGTPTEAKTAQMWATKDGKKLCDIEAFMVNNDASSDLNFFAPQAGTYELTVEEMPEDATLYLTLNDKVIWNLTYSPYTFDLAKGTTSGYGLRLVANAPKVATDVEQSESGDSSSVRKVLIDGKIYIITLEGKMYDIVGKSAKY